MKHLALTLLLPILFLVPTGCQSDNPDNGTTPPTNSTNPATSPTAIAGDISAGTSLILSIGLPLLPNQSATQADAKLALTSVNGALAILQNNATDAAGAAALIKQLVSGQLNSMDGSPVVQGLLKSGLGLLTANLSSGVSAASGAVDSKIPANDLLYMTNFFTAAKTSLTGYIAMGTITTKDIAPDTITAGKGSVAMADIKATVAKLAAAQNQAAKELKK